MQVDIVEPVEFGRACAEFIEEVLQRRPDALIGLPTGNTPLPLYAELRARAQRGWSAGRMRVVMIDDYLDVVPDEIGPYPWLRRELLDPLRIAADRVLRIPNREAGIEAACAAFERDLAAWGGCDLLLPGLGWNGHIGFNEPDAAIDSRTRVVKLTETTADLNALYWGGRAHPNRAVTMGIGTMLEARDIRLMVRGRGKAEVLRRALREPPSPAMPASWLQRAHSARVLADVNAVQG